MSCLLVDQLLGEKEKHPEILVTGAGGGIDQAPLLQPAVLCSVNVVSRGREHGTSTARVTYLRKMQWGMTAVFALIMLVPT